MSEADPPEPKVGYCRPPVEHQFPKGKSGNPRGRPRRLQRFPKGKSLDFGAQPANAMLMEEAYRQVTLREGDQLIQLPAIQAVFRAMGVAAMKGNRFAQRTLAELVRGVEEEDRQGRIKLFEAMVEYKVDAEREIERTVKLGQAPPEMLPHPDDIIIDLANASATMCGPKTKEEKVLWDRLLESLEELQRDISIHAASHRKSRSAERKDEALKNWVSYQRSFDEINDNLPKRYRRILKDRQRGSGASYPGSQRTQVWPGEE